MLRKSLKFLLLVLVMTLVACNEESDGTIPVYQGMELSGSNLIQTTTNERTFPIELSFLGSLFDSTDEITTTDSLDITGDEEISYFTSINQTILLTVLIQNPDEYEILSFTLNGTKYQSYMFEDGSDSEHLILEVNSGEVEGVKEFTIDQIKYIDGTDIKDVVISGNQTIKLGVTYSSIPTATITTQDWTPNEIVFTMNLTDNNNLITNEGCSGKIFLYDGLDLVEEQNLTSDVNIITFSNLSSRKLYSYEVILTYDALDGNGLYSRTVLSGNIMTSGYLEFTDVTAEKESITFDLILDDPDGYGSITSIKLYQNEYLIENLSNLETREFSDLLSGVGYRISATYTYNLGDAKGNQTETINYNVSTISKIMPIVSIINIIPTYDSVDYDILITDTDGTGEILGIEIYTGINIISQAEDLLTRSFTGLLSDTEYEINVAYNYDLNDGIGVRTLNVSESVRTLAYTVPEVIIDSLESTQDTISFQLLITDTDSRGELTSIELFQGESLISTASLDQREFTGLINNTLYSIKAIYNYDLNDGTGPQEIIETHDYPTLAQEITVNNIFVLNSVTPEVGDEIHLQIFFTNPSGIIIDSFFINDIEISVVGDNVISQAVVVFIPDFEGGIYNINITSVTYSSYNNILSQMISSSFSEEILIMGGFEVLSVYNEFDSSVAEDQDNYIIIELYNPTGFEITAITIRYFNLDNYYYTEAMIEQIDDNHLRVLWKGFDFPHTLYENLITIENITYGFEGEMSISKAVSKDGLFMIYHSFVKRYISTVNDLQNMESGYVYVLINDIDFTGQHWTPYQFFGTLDGNGYSIINLSIVASYDPEMLGETYVGLFTRFKGVIQNLEIKNIYISVNSTLDARVGSLIGNTSYAIIRNNIITGTITNTISSTYYALAGGIIGEAYGNVWIYNNYVYMNITATATDSLSVFAAGYVGSTDYNCKLYLSNNIFGGQIRIISRVDEFLPCEGVPNGFLGSENRIEYDYVIEDNYYTTDSQLILNGGEVIDESAVYATVTELNSVTFYSDTLEWDTDIWDLSNLNYNSGLYPNLIDNCS